MRRFKPILILLFLSSFLAKAQDNFELNLDEETARPEIIKNGIFQVDENSIYYLNRISNNIKVFDLKTGNTISTIPLAKAGPNTVGPQVETFHVLNKDSIFVFSEFFKSQISLINSDGKLIKQYATWPKDLDSKYSGQQLSEKTGGIQVSKPFVYMSHMIYDLSTRQEYSSITVTDMGSGDVNFVDAIPKTHQLIDITRLQTEPSYLSPTTVVTSDSRLIVNYPISNELFSFYRKKEGFNKYKVMSKKMKPMKLLSKPLSTIGKEQYMRERRDISIISGYYPNLIYDKFKNKFYRIVRLPYDENVLKRYRQGISSKLPPYTFSVIELDENLNILSEWVDEKSVLHPERGVFVDERGLWIIEREVKNEDKMIFQKVEF